MTGPSPMIGLHVAGALIAVDRGTVAPDPTNSRQSVVAYNRERVLASARSLLGRITVSRLPGL